MTFGDLLRGAEAEERRAREALEATEIAVPVDVRSLPRPLRARPSLTHESLFSLPLPAEERRAGRETRARSARRRAASGAPSRRRDRAVRVHGRLGARQLLRGGGPGQHPPRHTQVSPSAAAPRPVVFPRKRSATPVSPSPISEKPKTNVQLFGPGDTSPQSTPGSTTSSRTSPTPNRRVPHRCIHDARLTRTRPDPNRRPVSSKPRGRRRSTAVR